MKEYNRAIEQFEKAILIDRNNVNSWVAVARAYSGLNKHQTVIKIYDGLIDIIKTPPQIEALKKLRQEEYKKINQGITQR